MSGTIWQWGSAWYVGGVQQNAPVQIGTDDTWASLSFGYEHGAGVKDDGTLWVWGEGGSGELGLNSATDQSSPVQVGSATNWAWVSCGYAHTLAIKTDGTLWATGANYSGQLGQGNTTDLDEFTQIGSATDWAKCYAIADSSFATKTSGALWACGDNSYGHLGDNSTTQRNSLVAIGAATWSDISGDPESTAGIQSDGTLWTWGRGDNGRLGLGNTTTYHTPQQVGSSTWLSVGIGNDCVGVKADGTLWQWGGGTSTPEQVGSVSSWAWCSVAAMGNFAARETGALYSWSSGSNTYGQLGQGDTASYTIPTQIGTSATWAVVTGQYSTLFARLDSGASPESLALPLVIRVGELGGLALPLVVDVLNIATLALPLTVHVREIGDIDLPLAVNVYNKAIFSTTATTTRATESFSAVLMLGGSNVSAYVTDAISIDAEANAARTADFSLRLSGAVNPTQWAGAAVSIDYVVSGMPWRVFTGRVIETDVDLQNSEIRFTCADGRNVTLGKASADQVDSITDGAYHSTMLYGAQATGTDYLTQRMASLAADVDLDARGNIQITPWFEGSPRKTFTEADLYDASAAVRVSISPVDTLTGESPASGKKIKIIVEYRYQRLRRARMAVAWGTGELYYLPTPDVITNAMDSLTEGWKAERMVLTQSSFGATPRMSAALARRWVQDVTKTYTYTLREDGVALDAPDTKTTRISLASRYDEAAWVDEGIARLADAESDPVTAANISIKAVLNAEKKAMLADRRAHSVSFDLPLDPTFDLSATYRINTARLDATGKAARIQHVIDLANGSATSTLTLALYGAPNDGSPDPGDSDPIIHTLPVSAEVVADTVFRPPEMHTQISVQPIYGHAATPNWALNGWAIEVRPRQIGTTRVDLTEINIDYGRLRDITGRVLDYRDDAQYVWDVIKSQFLLDIPEVPATDTDPLDLAVAEDFVVTLPRSDFSIEF